MFRPSKKAKLHAKNDQKNSTRQVLAQRIQSFFDEFSIIF
jgi:hypothetical protein